MTEKDAGDAFIPYDLPRLSAEEMIAKSKAFAEELETRRSVRVFSQEPIPLEAVRHCIDAACTAPSGAHKQPSVFLNSFFECMVVASFDFKKVYQKTGMFMKKSNEKLEFE